MEIAIERTPFCLRQLFWCYLNDRQGYITVFPIVFPIVSPRHFRPSNPENIDGKRLQQF